MRTIPVTLRYEMAADPFYQKCCVANSSCIGRPEWHHVWIYAGKQINEKWAIVPACRYHHKYAEQPDLKRRFQRISLDRATKQDLLSYPKKDWKQIMKSLKKSTAKS